MRGSLQLTLQPHLLRVLQRETEDQHVSGHSFQVILQHIELEGWTGEHGSEICVPGS